MNKDVIILVTHTLNKVIIEKYRRIKKQFEKNGDTFILFNNEDNEEFLIPQDISCIQFTVEQLNELQYEPIEETIIPGSNHFALLWFYLNNPQYRYYWNIEYDVDFSGEWKFLFDSFTHVEADFVSSHIMKYTDDESWFWWNTYKNNTIKIPLEKRLKSFNPIYRIHAKALFFLDDFLKKGNTGHHEVLIPTTLHHSGYKLLNFSEKGEFVSPETMRFLPTFPSIEPHGSINKLFHPVKCDIIRAKLNVLAIVVTYNGKDTIRQCLGSLLSSKYPVTIQIIDNASEDNTRQIIEEEYPTTILIKNNKNIGFGQANNMGFEYAKKKKFDYVFILNQDAYIEENTIFDLILAQNTYPEYHLLSPMHYSNKKNILDENFFRYVCTGSWSFLMDAISHKKFKPVYTSAFINAAAWLLTTDCIKVNGGFDPIFFHTGEDIDYYNRLQFNHFRSGIVPHTKIFHLRSNKGKNTLYENTFYHKYISILVRIKNPMIKYSFTTALNELFFDGLNYLLRGQFENYYKTCMIYFKIIKKKLMSEI
jgi:GT2 family glycosyltransferase